jgi:hypothetical protein
MPLAKKRSTALAAIFAPREVGLNRDTDLLKVVAMITMLIDHAGKMFFPQYRIMRIIGRLAFPIYAYCIGVGCVYSRDRLKYLSRILLMGLISQPFYAMALAHTSQSMFAIRFADNPIGATVNFYINSWGTPNIMLELALGLLIIWSLRDGQYVCALAVMLVTWKIQNAVNYGWHGVALIVLFYLFIERWWLSLPVMLLYMGWWGMSGAGFTTFGVSYGIQMFALLALPLIYIPTRSRLKINKWVFYLFYPAHLIGIMLIQFAMKLGK